MEPDLRDTASLQHGAGLYMNYCARLPLAAVLPLRAGAPMTWTFPTT